MAQESRLAIVVDSSQARPSAENLARAMRALDEAGVRVSHTTEDVGAQMNRMAGQSNAAAAALRRGLIAALGSLSTMRVIDIADEWGQYASRIRMATQSVEEYNTVQARMLASANETYRSMGASLEKSMDVVDAFSGLLVVNSASADKAATAMRALTLSMQKGRMDVINWMTIANTMPSLIDEIAEHTGKSAEEIRKLGAEGKLSIQMLVDALGGQHDVIMKKVADMPTTVRDALTNVGNAFGEYVGKHNEANQVTATLAAGIEVLGKNIDTILNAALVGAGFGLTRYAGGMAFASAQTAIKGAQARKTATDELALARAQAAQTKATLAQVTVMQGLTASHAQVSAAVLAHEKATQKLAAAQAATAVAGRGLLAVLGGPMGIAIAAGMAASAFAAFSSASEKTKVDLEGLSGALDSAIARFRELGSMQREEAIRALGEQQREKAKQAKDAAWGFVNQLPVRGAGRDGVFHTMAELALQTQALLGDARLSSHQLQDELGKLLDAWVAQGKVAADVGQGYRRAALAMIEAQAAANDLRKRQAELAAENERLAAAATSAGSAQQKALMQSSEAAKSYLERLSDRALLAGLTTQREQLKALVAKGKLVFSPEDLARAREAADAYDRANARRDVKTDAGADTLQSLKERIALLGKTTEYEQMLARVQSGALDLGDRQQAVLQEAQKLDTLQQQIETERVLKDLREQQATTQMQFMRELAAFGEGENVRALNADLAKTEDHYRRLIEARRNSAHGLSDTELAQIQASLQEELAMVRQFHDDKLAIQQDWKQGAMKALKDYADESQNLYAQVGDAVKNAFKGMEDALAEFVVTGKMDFKSLADSIIQDMIRIAIQQSVTGPLARAFGGWLGTGSGGAASPPAGVTPGMDWTWSSGGYTGDGGRFEPAGIVHRGEGVLNQDEIRAIGGEAGFNALRRAIRGSGHAAGGMAGRAALPPPVRSGAAAGVTVTVNITESGRQTQATPGWEQFGNDIGRYVDSKMREYEMKSQRPGGLAWQARQGALA